MTPSEGFAAIFSHSAEKAAVNEARFRALVQAIATFVWVADPAGNFTVPQSGWEKYTGQAFQQHGGSGWVQAVHPDDRERVAEIWQNAVRSKSWYEVEWRCWHHATGRWRRCVTRGVPILGADGSVCEWVAAVTDVEHHLDVGQIFEREWLRQAQTTGGLGLWEWHPVTDRGRWTPELNLLFRARAGATQPELEDVIHTDDREKLIRARAEAAVSGTIDVTFRIVRPSGEIRWLRSKGGRVSTDDPKLVGVLVDVTDQIELQEKLRAQTDELRTLIDAIPAYVWVARDARGEVIVGNKTSNELLRTAANANVSASSWASPDDQLYEVLAADGSLLSPDQLPMQRVCRSGVALWNEDLNFRLRDGRRFSLIGNVVPLFDSKGSVCGCVAIFWDVTELKRTQEELTRSNRELLSVNERLSQFTFAVSHDLREPLREVNIFSELLERGLQGTLDADAQRYLEICRTGVTRINRLLDDLLSYIHLDAQIEHATEPSDSWRAFDDACQNLSVVIEQARAVIEAGDLPLLYIDYSSLVHLFQNLISNAIKYRSSVPPVIRVSAQREEAFWRFAVEDNGIGIDPKYHSTIFGLFKRLHNRQEYEGTGIGLSMCQRIVEQYGGQIWVESEPGKGSAFFFRLPAERAI